MTTTHKDLTDVPLTGPQEDLRKFPVHDRHRLVYSEQLDSRRPAGTNFLINGKMFDPEPP